MKQATNKLFRNCPHEDEFLKCKECPNYIRCKNRKKVRKVKKVEHFVNFALPNLAMVIAIITAIVVIIVCTIISAKGEKKVVATVTTESSLLVGDLVEENTTADSTEHTSFVDNSIEEEIVPEEKPSADENSQEYCYNLSNEDKVLLAKLVWAEARGENFEGKVAVAAVVLNRYYYGNDRDFNRNSIEAVINQPKQFASIQNVTMADLEAVPECMQAVEAACRGWDPTREVFPQGALYFFAHDKVTGYQKEIREGLKVMIIENHTFHYDFEKVR